VNAISGLLDGQATGAGPSYTIFPEEFLGRREKWILLQDAANNHQWMRAEDID
jgi:hypothetical protein